MMLFKQLLLLCFFFVVVNSQSVSKPHYAYFRRLTTVISVLFLCSTMTSNRSKEKDCRSKGSNKNRINNKKTKDLSPDQTPLMYQCQNRHRKFRKRAFPVTGNLMIQECMPMKKLVVEFSICVTKRGKEKCFKTFSFAFMNFINLQERFIHLRNWNDVQPRNFEL